MKFRRILWILAILIAIVSIDPSTASAQCAMCRASVESSVSDGGVGLGEGLNRGILYLMLAPYALLVVIGYAWFKHSQRYTEERRKLAEVLKRTV